MNMMFTPTYKWVIAHFNMAFNVCLGLQWFLAFRFPLKMRENLGDFNILLTVHLSITLVNGQLDAQLLYFIMRLLQSSTCFEQRRADHQEVKLH